MEVEEEKLEFEDGPADSTENRVRIPIVHASPKPEPVVLEDAPDAGVDIRLGSLVRAPAVKRKAQTGGMFTHDDEPDVKTRPIEDESADL